MAREREQEKPEVTFPSSFAGGLPVIACAKVPGERHSKAEQEHPPTPRESLVACEHASYLSQRVSPPLNATTTLNHGRADRVH